MNDVVITVSYVTFNAKMTLFEKLQDVDFNH